MNVDDDDYYMQSVPGTGDKEDKEDKGMTIEEKKEAERQRWNFRSQTEKEGKWWEILAYMYISSLSYIKTTPSLYVLFPETEI